MPSLTKPFDLLFKHTMSSDVGIKDFLKYHIPAHIYQHIDLTTIHPTKQSYVPNELRELHSDLVCRCTIKNQTTFIYFLVEHQSKASWDLPLRFIKYQVALLEDYLHGKPDGTLWPLVVCACFYHGEQTPYPYPTNIHDYYADAELSQQIGSFTQFQLTDLTIIDADQIKQHGFLALMEQILKYSRRRDFFRLVSTLLDEYKELLTNRPNNLLGEDYWYAVYLVVNRVFQKQGYGKDAAARLFSEKLNLSKTKEEIMTVTQAIRQEGIREEKLHIARNMLSKLHLDMQSVSEATGLSKEELMKLQEETQEKK